MENQETFSPADLLKPEVQIGNGQTVPLFFAVCQTGINNTSWKGSDTENVRHVKQQLVQLLKYCQDLIASKKPQDASKEPGVGIGDNMASDAPVANVEPAKPSQEPVAETLAEAIDEKKK